ncbi:hypothetical protein BOTCAL_0192g00180 [Botryotinia calthae]|uniref:DUF7587 domain-containing protein n=1 Tax=Botryotinia calthae TaxID=38488 RepID=A0A4Y8CZZ5_9HELO|nr:hypothetical protein BOTCAL_0192g00180 [Botryotinia calthae]
MLPIYQESQSQSQSKSKSKSPEQSSFIDFRSSQIHSKILLNRMSATLEYDFNTLSSNSPAENNRNNVFVIPPPKDLGTDGCTSSTEIRPSTPTPNSRNTPMLTPDHTPDSERLLSPWNNHSLSSPSKPGTFPDTPILTRDRYDLNFTRTSSRLHLQNHNLNLESKDLRAHYQNLQFYRKWTSHLISHLPGITVTRNLHSVIRNDNPYDFPPRADYPNDLTILTRQKNHLQKNEFVTAKSELQALTMHLISLPFPQIRENEYNDTDTLLYRVQTAASYSPYDRTTGIRCSGWIDGLYTSGIANERERDGEAFQSHCHYTPDPSPYISVSTSVARLMRFIEYRVDKEAESRVFVISLNRLKKLGIKAQSTEEYLKRFVNSQVSYVTETHWLIEGWIPGQAIVSEMDCGDFFKIAEREGINRVAATRYPFKEELEPLKIGLEKWPKRYASREKRWE